MQQNQRRGKVSIMARAIVRNRQRRRVIRSNEPHLPQLVCCCKGKRRLRELPSHNAVAWRDVRDRVARRLEQVVPDVERDTGLIRVTRGDGDRDYVVTRQSRDLE